MAEIRIGQMNFKKVDVQPRHGGTRTGEIWILKNKDGKRNTVNISSDIAKELSLQKGDRFDLYACGDTLALKKSPVGLFKATYGSVNSRSMKIPSIALCLEIRAVVQADRFKAWVEDGAILFRGVKEDGGEN